MSFMSSCLEVRPCLLFTVTVVSEAKISSNVPVFMSPDVLDFPKDFLNRV